MALINCSECNHEISDKASSCPNCGHPLRESKWDEIFRPKFKSKDEEIKIYKKALYKIAALLLIVILMLLSNPSEQKFQTFIKNKIENNIDDGVFKSLQVSLSKLTYTTGSYNQGIFSIHYVDIFLSAEDPIYFGVFGMFIRLPFNVDDL